MKTEINQQMDLMFKQFSDSISQLEPIQAHFSCRKVVEGIDVIMNFITEISDEETLDKLMETNLNSILINDEDYINLKPDLISEIGTIYVNLFEGFIIDFAGALQFLKTSSEQELVRISKSFTDVHSLFQYVSQRRRYFVTFLTLIPNFSKGENLSTQAEFLELEISLIEKFMVSITTGRNILLMDACYEDFELTRIGGHIVPNKQFSHLEGLSLEPQRLTLVDELEFRPIYSEGALPYTKPLNQMFSFNEVKDALGLYERIFSKYKVNKISAFTELQKIVPYIEQYIDDDFRILIPIDDFDELVVKFPSLRLSINSDDYFEHLNSHTPFSPSGDFYYSNAMLFNRFIVNTLQSKLEKNKRFQVHSGFIFEDKIVEILERYGFKKTDITRINRKEFDVVTIKNNEIHNFQCKNNLFEISIIDLDYKKTAKLNNKLCSYYESAYKKEIQREDLLKNKLGISKITHYVISRFPVLTNQDFVINFNSLEQWLKNMNK